MIKLSLLNGWQRIFIAFLIFIYLPIMAIVISDKPYIAGLTTTEFLEKAPTDLLLEIQAKKAFYTSEDSKPSWDVFVDPDKFIMIDYNFANSWRYTLAIDKSVGEEKAIVMGEKLGDALNADYKKKLLLARGKTFAIFISFAVALYAFGWTLGWVYRGFKKNKE